MKSNETAGKVNTSNTIGSESVEGEDDERKIFLDIP
jgi:hypothetical protein